MVITYAKGAFMPWRLVAWLGIIYTLVPVILIHMFVPESPVWLVSKGRIEDAARSLTFLYKAYPQPEHTVSCTLKFIIFSYANYRISLLPDTTFGRYALSNFATRKRSPIQEEYEEMLESRFCTNAKRKLQHIEMGWILPSHWLQTNDNALLFVFNPTI